MSAPSNDAEAAVQNADANDITSRDVFHCTLRRKPTVYLTASLADVGPAGQNPFSYFPALGEASRQLESVLWHAVWYVSDSPCVITLISGIALGPSMVAPVTAT